MRSISIFGATGSVGCNTVDLVSAREDIEVVAISGAGNIDLLARQAILLNVDIAVTADAGRLPDLADALAGSGIEVAAGADALVEAASRPVDWAMSAIVGAAGLPVSLAIAKQGGTLALANKESLVCAGALLKAQCAAHGTTLLPVDSEHCAIFQALNGEDHSKIERIILTASGGPFRTWSRQQMAVATPAEAVAHPNWSMGERISIDSASMFNKAMELIETKELFSVQESQIEVLIHPQSIIHSMVGFIDGAIIAQLGPTDMRGAIGYALNYPDRLDLPVERIDFTSLSNLTFESADVGRFPALRLARQVANAGGLFGAAFNAAKETALNAYLSRQIGFLQMAEVVEQTLAFCGKDLVSDAKDYTLDDVLTVDSMICRKSAEIAADMVIEA